MNRHPGETDLALLAGGECGRVSQFFLKRHVRECRDCTATLARFEILRAEMSRMPEPDMLEPDMDWSRLSAEMKANIRLGLAAGECVRDPEPTRGWNPRLGVAFASLLFLVAAGLTMNSKVAVSPAPQVSVGPVLTSTGAGPEMRDGSSSITMLTHGGTADQSVNAEGEFLARSVENGAVTITSVSF